MEQRPLRLGDIVDDYCPRERRITNHAIVALIGDAIRQTRCTTCEAEHVYKEAKVPRRRKKGEAGAPDDQLAEVAPGALVAPAEAEVDDPPAMSASAPAEGPAAAVPTVAEPEMAEPAPDSTPAAEPEAEPAPGADEAWFGHRRLIRASLPKTDVEPPPRPIPEFTMHQRQTRGGQSFRHGQPGNGNGRSGFRHGRPGGNGQSTGNGPGQGGGRPHRGGRGRNRNNKRPR